VLDIQFDIFCSIMDDDASRNGDLLITTMSLFFQAAMISISTLQTHMIECLLRMRIFSPTIVHGN
jgi:hypothetical protein